MPMRRPFDECALRLSEKYNEVRVEGAKIARDLTLEKAYNFRIEAL